MAKQSNDALQEAAETIRQFLEKDVMASHLQVGGDETLGRGIFELSWM